MEIIFPFERSLSYKNLNMGPHQIEEQLGIYMTFTFIIIETVNQPLLVSFLMNFSGLRQILFPNTFSGGWPCQHDSC